MVARVSTFQVNADKLDEVVKAFKEGVIPAVKLRKGYQNGYLFTDSKTGKCVSIAFWDSEEDALADERSGYFQQRVDLGKDYYTVPPVREIYEVAVQD